MKHQKNADCSIGCDDGFVYRRNEMGIWEEHQCAYCVQGNTRDLLVSLPAKTFAKAWVLIWEAVAESKPYYPQQLVFKMSLDEALTQLTIEQMWTLVAQVEVMLSEQTWKVVPQPFEVVSEDDTHLVAADTPEDAIEKAGFGSGAKRAGSVRKGGINWEIYWVDGKNYYVSQI